MESRDDNVDTATTDVGCLIAGSPIEHVASVNDLDQPVSKVRRRGRFASACSQCHTRKQRCSGGQPCVNCARRGVESLCSGAPRQSQGRSGSGTGHVLSRKGATSSSSDQAIDTDHQRPNTATNAPQKDLTSPLHIGHLWKSRDAPAFFGTSYFGPQVAAAMIDSAAPVVQAGIASSRKSLDTRPFRDEAGPFSQIWDLLGLLPRRKSTVDHLVDLFFATVNQDIDAVHPASFRRSYAQFWDRKSGFDDVTTVDLRWLALLFVILAIGVWIDCPQDCSSEAQQDCEEASLRFYWASRRAIVLAPSFYGESTDLVRAGTLITRYLVQTQRFAESWLTVGFAARIGIAQGLHVDGEKLGLPRRSTETRRRLWCHLYTLDRMIALALGRPYCISDSHTILEEPGNIFVDDFTDEDAEIAQALPLETPTISIVATPEYRLAKLIGQIQDTCFHYHTISYKDVLALDEKLIEWTSTIPSYFSLHNPDTSLDERHPFLKWQRTYLHTTFHFARITLHRPYLLRQSLTDRYQPSRGACLSSARADLKTRLDHHTSDIARKYTWSLAAHQLCNSAIIIGILAVKDPQTPETAGIVEDLEAYCSTQRSQIWISEFGLAEVAVIEMCINKLKQQLRGARERIGFSPRRDLESAQISYVPQTMNPNFLLTEASNYVPMRGDFVPLSSLDTSMNFTWPDQAFTGPLPNYPDLQTWQEIIDSLGDASGYGI